MTNANEFHSRRNPHNPKTPEARMRASLYYLKTLGIPCPADLPLLRKEGDYKIRSVKEITERIAILANISALQSERDADKKQERVSKIKQLHWFQLSAYEKQMVETAEFRIMDVFPIVMYPDIVHIWLWALGVEKIDLPGDVWDSKKARAIYKEIEDNPEAGIKSESLRPITEILDVYDLICRLHFAVLEARSKREKMPHGILLGAFTFRAIALIWLLNNDKDWDDILYGVFHESYDALGNEIEYEDDDEDWDEYDPNIVGPAAGYDPLPGVHGHDIVDIKFPDPSDRLRKAEDEG